MSQVEGLGQAVEQAHGAGGVLGQIVLGRGAVQAALRVKHVLAPRLVEADRDVVVALREGAQAGGPEAPGAEEARAARGRQGVVADPRWQGALVPAAGVQVDLVPVRYQAPGQVRNVGFAAAARRQHALVAEGDLHGIHP